MERRKGFGGLKSLGRALALGLRCGGGILVGARMNSFVGQ